MPKRDSLKRLIGDIRFWLIFFFTVRLYGITNAPLEFGHSWRQSLTNMVSRNFVEQGADLLHPTIDMAGNQSGVIASEFPFFNYLTYLFSEAFGYEHWYGRLINLTISTLGIYFFYKLLKSILNQRVAFFSAMVLIVSIWFGYSRKTMPDTFSVALLLMGLYYAYAYLTSGKWYFNGAFFFLCTLGMLCKIPALSLFSVLILIPFLGQIDLKRRLILSLTAMISFAIVCLWYFYWVPHLLETYEYQLYFPKGLLEGMNEISMHIPELFEQFYFNAHFSFLGFAAFLIGAVLFFWKREFKLVKIGIGIVSLVFGLFILKTGAVFPTHSYYIVPFVPIMALFAGYWLTRIPKVWGVVLMVLIAAEGIGNQQHDFFIKESEKYKLSLEATLDGVVPKEALIVINGGDSPQHIYFANRRGWTIMPELITYQSLDSLSELGAGYLVFDKSWGEVDYSPYKVIHSDEHFSVYRLKNSNGL